MNLGEKVLIRAFVKPIKRWEARRILRRLNRIKVQESKRTVFLDNDWWIKGVVCGKRVLQEGNSVYYNDDGWIFTREKYVPVYLVAANLGQMFRVLPEDMRRLNDRESCAREECFPPNAPAMDLKVGDRVCLTDKRPPWWSVEGLMDKYLGRVVTIREVDGMTFRVCGSGNGKWLFSTTDIVEKVSSAHWDTAQPEALQDSGDRREFGTGAVRDMAEGKGRYDLLPCHTGHEIA